MSSERPSCDDVDDARRTTTGQRLPPPKFFPLSANSDAAVVGASIDAAVDEREAVGFQRLGDRPRELRAGPRPCAETSHRRAELGEVRRAQIDADVLQLAATLLHLDEGVARIIEDDQREGSPHVARRRELAEAHLEAAVADDAGHRGVALRVMCDQRVASTSTSDWSEEGLDRCVADALSLAQLSEKDPFAGPADEELSSGPYPDLDLFDPNVDALGADEALSMAERAEKVALDSDPRLVLSEGATLSRVSGWSALVLSGGFAGVRRGSFASLSMVPVVEDEGGKKRRGHYWSGRRHLSDLESVERVGQVAAERTLRQLGARSVATCQAPVVFDTEVARSLLSSLIGCALGGAVWRRSSYLAEREGTPVASPLVTIVDDPLIVRGPGSRTYDGEGLESRKNLVVEEGVLKTFLLDSYCARKLGKSSTRSAGRSGGGGGSSTSNLILHPGKQTPEEIIAGTSRGLFVTEMMGFGFNPVTGDFSRGAAGFWIEGGKLTHPVSEVTISSNLDAMFKGIDAVGSDLRMDSSTAAPTLRVDQMTIAGS